MHLDTEQIMGRRPTSTLRKAAYLILGGVALYLSYIGYFSYQASKWEIPGTDDRPLHERMVSHQEVFDKLNWEFASALSNAELVTQVAQLAVKEVLRDPASAQFTELFFTYSPQYKMWWVCGQVNAKNGFGGYTGFKQFAAPLISDNISRQISFGNIRFFDPVTISSSQVEMDRILNSVKSKCGLSASIAMLAP